MHDLAEMLEAHPDAQAMGRVSSRLEDCIDACFACAETCESCADACLAEQTINHLVGCIRLNRDCADICAATGAILTRLTEPSDRILRAQLKACAVAAQVCAEECDRHANDLRHCAICADVCRDCERACKQLLIEGAEFIEAAM